MALLTEGELGLSWIKSEKQNTNDSESATSTYTLLSQGMTLSLGRLTFGKEEQNYVIR